MPDAIDSLRPQLDRADRSDIHGVWIRRTGIGLLLAVTVAALLNLFGQHASTAGTRSAVADLSVHSPTRVRAGLLYQAKITITAHQALPKAQLVLDNALIDGLTLNTVEPSAPAETSGPGGSLVLTLGRLRAGQTFVQYLDYQVNPTSSGSRHQAVTLKSDGVPVVSVGRSFTVIP
jgi:hypothetical protein